MTIAEALRAAAQYVETNLTSIAWDRGEMQSEDDKTRIAAEVASLGHELDSLAAASEAATIHHREYEGVKGELQKRGFFLTSEIAQVIADAFQAQAAMNPPHSRALTSRRL